MRDHVFFAGTANRPLGERVAREMGVELADCELERFPDGEIAVRLGQSVRGREVVVLQPMSRPVNENLVELLAFADACRRATGRTIAAAARALGEAGARADFTVAATHPVFSGDAVERLSAAGVGHVVVTDSIPLDGDSPGVDVVSIAPLLAAAVARTARGESLESLF